MCYDMSLFMKANKTVSLAVKVTERLEEEDNQSPTVKAALRSYFDGDSDAEEDH